MVIVGGVGTLFGGVVGAAVIIFTRNIVSLFTSRWPTVMGLIFVLTILFAPNGLLGAGRAIFDRIMEARRGRAAPKEEVVAEKDKVNKPKTKVAPEG